MLRIGTRTLQAVLCGLLLSLPAAVHATELSEYEYLSLDATLDDDEALRHTGWTKATGSASFGFLEHTIWVRYNLPPSESRRVIQFDNPWIKHLRLLTVANGEIQRAYELGAIAPRADKPIMSLGPSAPLPKNIDQVLVRIGPVEAANLPVHLFTNTEFSASAAKRNLLLGMYYGLVSIMVLYNLAIFFGTRDPAYLALTSYAACLMVLLTNADGVGPLFLLTDSPWFTHFVVCASWGLALICLLEFALRIVAGALSPRMVQAHRITQVIVGLFTAWAIVDNAILPYTMMLNLAAFALLVFDGARASLQGSRSGIVFMVANGMLVIGATLHILMLFGVLAPSTLLQHAAHIGSLLELSFLAIALSLRLRDSERDAAAAHQLSRELDRKSRQLSAATSQAEEQRRLQKSLQQAQKLKTIGQLAGGFAHDFNNILASILGFAELARDPNNIKDRGRVARYLEEIESSGRRGAELVKQLLVYSRSTQSEPRELELTDTLRQSYDLLRASLPATIDIDHKLPDGHFYLHMDPEQLQQVLVNLAINSAEAMHNRGNIIIAMQPLDEQNFVCTSCGSQVNGEYVMLSVKDDGEGISGNPSDLFTPFQTSKAVGQGSGLGLSVVHGIVHEHNGHILAANRSGGGASFSIYLPTQDAVATEDCERGQAHPPDRRRSLRCRVSRDPARRRVIRHLCGKHADRGHRHLRGRSRGLRPRDHRSPHA